MKYDEHDEDLYARLRAAIGWRLLTAPDRPTSTELGFLEVLGHGVVPVTGADRQPWGRWTIEGTRITVADVRAFEDRLRREGLGSHARVVWRRPGFAGEATAWGPTASLAVGTLVADLREHWPAVEAAGADPVLDGDWSDGELRLTGAGVMVAAPEPGDQSRRPVLRLRRPGIQVTVAVDGGAGWLDRLREALTVDPREAVEGFAQGHADAEGWPRYVWNRTDQDLERHGTVGPVEPTQPVTRR